MTNSCYHPVFNHNGTYKDSADKFWYESTLLNSVADCFKTANIGTANGRPDNKGLNVYKNDFILLFNTIQEDTLTEKEKRRSAYYAGKGGVRGLVSVGTIDYTAKTATHKTLPILSNSTSLVTDIIGDPANYPQSWKDRLAEGKPLVGMYANLVNVNDGNSQIPLAGTTPLYLLYNKQLSTNSVLRRSIGVTAYATVSIEPNSDNTIFTNFADFDLYICNYTTKNIPLIQSDPKPIEYISPKEVNTNSHRVYKSNLISNVVTGGIATGDVANAFESKVLENVEIAKATDLVINNGQTINLIKDTVYELGADTTKYKAGDKVVYVRDYGNWVVSYASIDGSSDWTVIESVTIAYPQHATPTLTSSTSKASKSFFATAKDSKGIYDVIFGQELIDANGYHSTKFDNLSNGTTLDDVGTAVKTKVLVKQTQYRR